MKTPLGLLDSADIAIDLGTANTRIGNASQRIVAEAPSRGHPESAAPLADGPISPPRRDSDSRVTPLAHGVVRDAEAVVQFLRPLIRSVRGRWLTKPRVLVCAPTDASDRELGLLVEATLEAGAEQIAVLPEPFSAAVGADLDVSSPYAQMLVDIGEGVTDVAVIRSGEIQKSAALRVACGDLRAAVQSNINRLYQIPLSADDADRLIRDFSEPHEPPPPWLVARRRHTKERRGPARVVVERESFVRTDHVADALDPLSRQIAAFVASFFRSLDHHDAAEIVESGLHLTGGGALLRWLVDRIASLTHLDVRPANDPLRAVVRGASRMLPQAARENLWARQRLH